jgi:hypothetical protein
VRKDLEESSTVGLGTIGITTILTEQIKMEAFHQIIFGKVFVKKPRLEGSPVILPSKAKLRRPT